MTDENDTGLRMKYFVLKPSTKDAYGRASLIAMRYYAISIAEENPDLAKDLRNWIESIENPGSILQQPSSPIGV